MADFDKISINRTYYNVKDTTARQQISAETAAREQADSQLSQQIIEQTAATGRLLTSFGAVGDGQTDDSVALKNAIETCSRNGIALYIDDKTFYVASLFYAECTKPVKIIGLGNATIKTAKYRYGTASPIPGQQFVSYINIQAPTVSFDNLHFTGSAGLQWDSDIANMYFDNPILFYNCQQVRVVNCNFANLWGTSVYITDSTKTEVYFGNCDWTEVGGHYKVIDAYDMFGDAVDLDRLDMCNIVFDSCNAVGRAKNVVTSGFDVSRCFLTCEFDNGTYNITVNSCNIQNYERVLHSEYVGNVKVVFNSTHIKNAVLFCFNYTNTSAVTEAVFISCDIMPIDRATWNGASGFCYDAVTVINSVFHCKTDYICDSTKACFINCDVQLDTYPTAKLTINKKVNSYTLFDNCTFNLSNATLNGFTIASGAKVCFVSGFIWKTASSFDMGGARTLFMEPLTSAPSGWSNYGVVEWTNH